ncbi:MAG: cellulase family glycosylhydrolase, partial [Candidatus Methylacidiphilales bacterium]
MLGLTLQPSLLGQTTAPAENLVPNGGFEEKDPSGAPVAWGKGDPEKGLSWQEEAGEHFMRLVSQDPGKAQMLYRVVPLPAGLKGMEVTFRYRTASVVKGDKPPGDARAIMHYQQAGGKKIEPAPPAITFSPNKKEWTEVTKRFLVPAGATALEMMPGLWNVKSGTLDIAEIRVKPMTDTEVAAMLKAKDDEKALQEKREAIIAKEMTLPSKSVELKVSGNKVLGPDGKPVWLQGLCVDSMEWSYGERVQWSLHVAIDEWKSNAIRLPVSRKFWFGKAPYQKPGSEEEYRKKVDEAVKLVSTKGGWLVLDLHGFGAPTEGDLAFWKDAAARYKNNPAVIFELFNEPHGISWKIWRDGGNVKSPENVSTDVNPSENSLKLDRDIAIGMQTLINAVRETGAKNIIIAGGVDWGYDLTGVVNAPLNDPSGNGIIYSSHIYPWKKDWQPKVLDAAA